MNFKYSIIIFYSGKGTTGSYSHWINFSFRHEAALCPPLKPATELFFRVRNKESNPGHPPCKVSLTHPRMQTLSNFISLALFQSTVVNKMSGTVSITPSPLIYQISPMEEVRGGAVVTTEANLRMVAAFLDSYTVETRAYWSRRNLCKWFVEVVV